MHRLHFGTRIAAFALWLSLVAGPASAHARLQKAVPPVDGAVTAAPDEIRLTFSEGVEPKLTGIALTDAAGKKVATGQPSLDPANNAELVVPITQPLAPGVYTVKWHAVSEDSHKTQGSFKFTVKS